MTVTNHQIALSPISAFKWFLLSKGNKKRNKKLLLKLVKYNRQGTAPGIIYQDLKLRSQDIDFLLSLSQHQDGYLGAVYSEGAYNRLEHLSSLGLVLLKSLSRRLSLADAGRFLLVLILTPGLTPPACNVNNL